MRTATCVIVGAGQAGLAMSRELSHRGVDHVVLERGAIANAWRTERWESLRLLTPNWASTLPGAPYRGSDPHGFMPASELTAQLNDYALRIDAPVEIRTEVLRVTRTSDWYLVETNRGAIRCEVLVVATGACGRPKVPAFSAAIPARVFQTTPSAYKRASDLPAGAVLVVGASASGVQLAREIQLAGRQVTLAVGNHIRLPRTYRGRDVERWLDVLGFLDERFEEIEDLQRARRAPSPQLTGGPDPVDLNALQKLGVEIVGRVADIRAGKMLFSGGLAGVCAAADLKMNRFLHAVDAFATECGFDGELLPPHRSAPTRLPQAPALERDLCDRFNLQRSFRCSMKPSRPPVMTWSSSVRAAPAPPQRCSSPAAVRGS